MGLHRLPRIRDYWSRNKIFYTEVIANAMPRNEFHRIFTALHLLANAKQNQFAKSSKKFKLFKVFDFICLLKRNFQANFILRTNICIDESMIKFKGRSSLKQYTGCNKIIAPPPFIFEIFQQRRIARLNRNGDLNSPWNSLSNTIWARISKENLWRQFPENRST